jgi:hypothetical protein
VSRSVKCPQMRGIYLEYSLSIAARAALSLGLPGLRRPALSAGLLVITRTGLSYLYPNVFHRGLLPLDRGELDESNPGKGSL